jgi:hypothetical protein
MWQQRIHTILTTDTVNEPHVLHPLTHAPDQGALGSDPAATSDPPPRHAGKPEDEHGWGGVAPPDAPPHSFGGSRGSRGSENIAP